MTIETAADPSAIRRAWCCGRKLTATFGDAGPEIQILTLVLWAAVVAAIVIWILGLRRAEARTLRQLGWLAAWRTGAPLLACAGVSYLAMNNFVAAYAYPPADFRDYAPGLAEMAMVLWSGLLAGGIASIAYASLSARTALTEPRLSRDR